MLLVSVAIYLPCRESGLPEQRGRCPAAAENEAPLFFVPDGGSFRVRRRIKQLSAFLWTGKNTKRTSLGHLARDGTARGTLQEIQWALKETVAVVPPKGLSNPIASVLTIAESAIRFDLR
jgi:hypothetical protein